MFSVLNNLFTLKLELLPNHQLECKTFQCQLSASNFSSQLKFLVVRVLSLTLLHSNRNQGDLEQSLQMRCCLSMELLGAKLFRKTLGSILAIRAKA